jgi:hypothetical protein
VISHDAHSSPPFQKKLSPLASSRVVNIVGPRPDGKSTLVRELLASAAYVTLDDDEPAERWLRTHTDN